MEKHSLFKKNDIIIVLVLLLLAAAGLFVFRIINGGEGKRVRVTVDGELYAEYELFTESGGSGKTSQSGEEENEIDAVAGGGADSGTLRKGGQEENGSEKPDPDGSAGERDGQKENRDELRVEIPGKEGKCILVIRKGEAYVESAECPNQICVHHSPISHKGETIVCLPNRIVVEIVS